MTKGKRKKRTWIIAGVIGTVVIALIIVAIVLLAQADSGTETKPNPEPSEPPQDSTLSLEELLQGKLSPNPFNGTWVKDNVILYTDSNGDLVLDTLSNTTSTPKVILSAEKLIPGGNNFEISADNNYLKVAHAFQKVYRHSYTARYTIINLHNTSEQIVLRINDDLDFRLAIWSPIGNALAFVFHNNIYFKESVTSDGYVQITNDNGYISNGIPDWVYEEEVFSSNTAMWFSPDGRKLAYGRFDDTQVPLMVLPIYGEPGNIIFQYPRANIIKYPKVGTINPTVSLHCVDLSNVSDNKKLSAPSDLETSQQPILSAVSWATNDTVSAIWMNRIQNHAAIVTYSISQPTETMEIIQMLHEDKGWLELFTAPIFSKDGSSMVLILSSDQGENLGAYRHVVLLPRTANAPRTPLTKGAFVVTEILGWNHERNLIFYTANTPEDSAVQHLYSISVDSKEVKCLSCGIKSKNKQVDCLYNVAEFSKDASYYVLTCAGPDIPDVSVFSLDAKVLDWNENKELQEITKNKKLPITKRLSFNVDGGFQAQVILKLPANFDESGETKYPMLVNVYAGPDSFQVVEKFNIDWGSYLAANKSIIYATIDGRSSGLKGNDMLFASYRNLGTVEIIDQINVTKQIQDTLPYVDASRTAVWGWSYGGYASGMILADDKQGIFKCGISVAPVTDWTLYDSIYTERFMGLPTIADNYNGYKKANLLEKYENLRDKQYFLIHGTLDDNVHYQQSMLWARVLEQNDILFRQLTYPDEDHGLGSVRPHLYHSLENFLDECFIEKEN